MEAVDLVSGELVDVALHVLRAEEVATHVEVHAPIGEARCVLDQNGRDLNRRHTSRPSGRKYLTQRLQSVEDSSVIASAHEHGVSADTKPVRLRRSPEACAQADVTLTARATHHRQLPFLARPHRDGPDVGELAHLGVALGNDHAGLRPELKSPGSRLDDPGPRDEGKIGNGGCGSAGRGTQ